MHQSDFEDEKNKLNHVSLPSIQGLLSLSKSQEKKFQTSEQKETIQQQPSLQSQPKNALSSARNTINYFSALPIPPVSYQTLQIEQPIDRRYSLGAKRSLNESAELNKRPRMASLQELVTAASIHEQALLQQKPESNHDIKNPLLLQKPPGLRSNLSKETVKELKKWIYDHRYNPYPTEQQKREMCQKYHIPLTQLNHWFNNARKRFLKKILMDELKDENSPTE